MGNYISKFNTTAEFDTFITTSECLKPHVSLTKDNHKVHYIDYSHKYLTFVALENGTFTLTIGSGVSTSILSSVSYSTDDGETWISTNNQDDTTVTITTPTISQGNKVLWKGVGTAMSIATNYTAQANIPSSSSIFSSTKRFNAEGNVMSLLYGDSFEDKTTFANGSSSNFASLFYQATKLVSASNVYMAARIAKNYTYLRMFYGCTALTAVPTLQTKTVGQYCCINMFYKCQALATVPNSMLPAMTLTSNCYQEMFYGCTSLATAPELPATTLASNCYNCMFQDCKSLTTAPELPAMTLANYCYSNMFVGCTSLTTAPELPATALTTSCYQNMFYNCTSLTTAPELPAMTLAISCYAGMFYGCTSLTTAPELPAMTLSAYCYDNMFGGCTSLTTAPELLATTLAGNCYQYMFQGCTRLTTAPELPALELVSYCYQYMFKGCSNLNYIKAMFIREPGTSSTNSWVNGVASNGTFVMNSNADWNTGTTACGISTYPCDWTVETASS